MEISRRRFVGLTAAGAAAVSLPGTASATPRPMASPPGDVVGKITVGYQGWFACIGDNSPINGWWHWSNNWGQPPSPNNNAIKAWPDVREYTATYPTAYANLNNGQQARLSPTTTSRRSTRTSGGCSSTAATPPRCNGSTR